MTNKPALVKKKCKNHTHDHKTKPKHKPACHSSPVRTAHMTGYNVCTQYAAQNHFQRIRKHDSLYISATLLILLIINAQLNTMKWSIFSVIRPLPAFRYMQNVTSAPKSR